MLLPWRSGHISSHDRHVAYYLLQESKRNKGWSNRQWPGVHTMLHKKKTVTWFKDGPRADTKTRTWYYIKPSYLAQVIMLLTGIREVSYSNLNRGSGHLEGFRGFTQFLHENVLTVRQIRLRPVLQNSFQFMLSNHPSMCRYCKAWLLKGDVNKS
jgi:hypothetical protein